MLGSGFLNNKLSTKTLFFFFSGKGETGWGILLVGVLVAKGPKLSFKSFTAIIYWVFSVLNTA